jgi:hypothetical protein
LSKCRRKLCAGQSTFFDVFDIIRRFSTLFDVSRHHSTFLEVKNGFVWIWMPTEDDLNLKIWHRWPEKTVFLRFCYCFAKKLSF